MAAMAVMAAPASAPFASAPSRPALLRTARPLALEGRAPPAGATPAAPTAAAVAFAAAACGLTAARRRRGRGRALALRRAAKDGGKKALVKDQEDRGVRVAEKEEKDLDYVPSREDLEKEELELLEATGSLELQRKEEAYWKRRKYREQNPSQMDKWEMDMEAMRMDTQRRKLWGDLRVRSGKYKRMRGKQIKLKEAEIKYNRGFPVEDTEEDDAEEAAQDKRWIDMWRAAWPAQEAVDPHDPESFGFGLVGEVTGAHGIHGDVRVRADDLLCDQGFDPEEYLSYRQFSNWTEKSKRVHLKAPHRRFPRPFKILKGSRVQRRVFSLRLKGVDSVEQAMAMRGFKVYALEPPPGAEGAGTKAKDSEDFSGYDLYDADTTHFHTHDALELIGAKCVQLVGPRGVLMEDVLADFATAETPEAAEQVLADNGVKAVPFGEMSAVVPDFKIAPRFRCRQAAHNLLDITLYPEVSGGEGKYLEEFEDPDSPIGKFYGLGIQKDEEFERVVYVPFVPDMIARVDADRAGSTVYFTLPKGHIEATSFTCRKRFVDEKGLLAIPRGPSVKGLLPPRGKSHALRRRDGRRLPLHGTAPAPPADMPQPAGMIYPDFGPGVPLPPDDE